jgi:glutamate dehydrogenase (NAD(P)+)
VLIPAALGDVIDADVANAVQAKIIVEAANGPTTPAGDEVLKKRGITVIPDIYANAGGVTVSYFEWTQNIQQFSWEYQRVRSELEKVMRQSFAALKDCASQYHIDLRTAAYVVAIARVKRASDLRGY